MSQHILYICPYVEKDKSGGGGGARYIMLRKINWGGGEGARYILLERSLHWKSKNFTSKAIGATRKKLMWKKSEMQCNISAST